VTDLGSPVSAIERLDPWVTSRIERLDSWPGNEKMELLEPEIAFVELSLLLFVYVCLW
jgi:hypothetical protein